MQIVSCHGWELNPCPSVCESGSLLFAFISMCYYMIYFNNNNNNKNNNNNTVYSFIYSSEYIKENIIIQKKPVKDLRLTMMAKWQNRSLHGQLLFIIH